MSEKISSKEAHEINQKDMEDAEKERLECAEKEAKQGMQYNAYDGEDIVISKDGHRIDFEYPDKIPLLACSRKNMNENKVFPPYIFALEYNKEISSNKEEIPTIELHFVKYVKTLLLSNELQKAIRKEINEKFPVSKEVKEKANEISEILTKEKVPNEKIEELKNLLQETNFK